MNKLLLFLLLFGLGVGALWWFEGRATPSLNPVGIPNIPGAQQPREPDPSVPDSSPLSPKSTQPGLTAMGAIEFSLYRKENGLIKMEMASESSETIDGVDRLGEVKIDLYNALDAKSTLEQRWIGVLNAQRAEIARIEGESILPEYEHIIRLHGLSAEILGGQDLTDLEFDSPSGIVDLTDEDQTLFIMREHINIRSKELNASGEGAKITILNMEQGPQSVRNSNYKDKVQFIELNSDAKLEFLHRPKPKLKGKKLIQKAPTLVTVTSQGSMSVHRIDRKESQSRAFEAWDQARMILSGAQSSSLAADQLQGRMRSSAGQQEMLLEGVTADGDAVWNYMAHVLRGEHMELITDADGELSTATLTGFPSILLNLDLDQSKLDYLNKDKHKAAQQDEEDAPQLSQIFLRSDSKIHMQRESGRIKLTIYGPVTAESDSLLLRSVGDLVISFPYAEEKQEVKAGLVRFEAQGVVLMELLEVGNQPYSKLDTVGLSLKALYVDDDSPLDFWVKTQGAAVLKGALSDGRRLTVDTPRGLSFNHIKGELKFKQAFDVTLDVQAVDGARKGSDESMAFHANCKHLLQFNTKTQKLSAQDGITMLNELGSFRGDRIETMGNRLVEIWGGETSRVELRSDFGRVDADYIKVTDSFFLIRGDVNASLVGLPAQEQNIKELELTRLDMHCEELEIQLLQTLLQNITKCKASGQVTCELVGSVRSLELHHADQLNLLKTEQFATSLKLGKPEETKLHMDASGDVYAHVGLDTSRFQLWTDRIDVDPGIGSLGSEQADVIAEGHVRFDGSWRRPLKGEEGLLAEAEEALGKIDSLAFSGAGEKIEIFGNKSARLTGSATQRVELHGGLPSKLSNYQLSASSVQFGPEAIDAKQPEVIILPDDYRLVAGRLIADANSINLQGRTTVHGKTQKGRSWTLAADKVELHDPTRSPGDKAKSPGLLTVIEASGNVHFQLDGKIEAFADVLRRNALGIHLIGDPCTIITKSKTGAGTKVNSEWIDFNLEFEVITEMGGGRIYSFKAGDGGPNGTGQEDEDWSLEFLSFKTEFDQDSILFFLEGPHFTKQVGGEKLELQASYSLIWVPKDKWQDINTLGGSNTDEPAKLDPPKSQGSMDVFFDFIRSQRIADAVSEVYFEGPVQTFQNGELISRAEAVYLDLSTGRGLLTGVTLNIIGKFLGRRREKLTLKADWLRHLEDGSLTADKATITPCSYDQPHLTVVTGELKLSPLKDAEEPGYSVSIRKNGIEIYGLFEIPLPPLDFNTDGELKPQFPSIRFGNSARFGQLLSIKFTQPARRLGRFFHNLFTSDSDEVDALDPGAPAKPKAKRPYRAEYDIDASYLSSRGGLVDLGFSIREKEDRYWLEWINGLVLDNGRDRGFLRIPKRDRGRLRLWLRGQGQIKFGKSSLGFSYSDQSDPAVQSEFFESEYLRYERNESYLQWKRRDNNEWLQASTQWRVDEFRAGVEELPSVTAFRGRGPLLSLGSVDLVHSGSLNAAYLRRRSPSRFDLDNDGIDESILTSPLAEDGNYRDGLGAQNIFRVNTRQVIEAPLNLGMLGLRLTPFASFFGTYWDNDINQENAARVVGDVGVRLSTALWKRSHDGALHQFSPFVEYRNDVVNKVDGRPLDIDSTESALFGNFIQVGTRSRFDVKDDQSRFDFDFKGTYASDRSDGGKEGWLPLEIYSRLGINPEGRRFDVWYDGRFDAERSEVIYSHFSLGTRVHDDFGLQVGYTYGRDDNLVKLFDTASVSGFYRWTDKWEFEARQNFSLLEDQQLGFEMVLRRYGHDLIFELESKLREGEGSAIGFSVRPRLGFKPNRIGYTNW